MLATTGFLSPSSGAAARVLEPVEVLSPTLWIGEDLSNPLVVSPDGSSLYVVSSIERDRLLVLFNTEDERGDPSVEDVSWFGIGELPQGSRHPVISGDARFLYFASFKSVAVFSRTEWGGLDFAGRTTVEGFQASHDDLDISLSPDERFLYINGTDSVSGERIGILRRDRATGQLSVVGTLRFDKRLHGPLEFSPDGRYAYAIAEFLTTGEPVIRVLGRDRADGSLRPLEPVPDLVGFLDPIVDVLRVSRDGKLFYAAGSGRLVVFDREPATGELLLREVVAGGFGGRPGVSFVVSQDDRHLYLCGPGSPVHVYERDLVVGSIELVQTLPEIECGSLGLSADEERLYVAGFDLSEFPHRGGLAVLERNLVSGELMVASWLHNKAGLPEHLVPFDSVAVTPDDRHAYASYRDRGLMLLDRDLGDNGRLRSPRPATDVSAGPFVPVLTFSPDGRHLHALTSDSLHVFARDPADGSLDLIQRLDHRVTGIAFSPDGRHAYVAVLSEGILVYRRDPVSGKLTEIGRWDYPARGNLEGGGLVVPPDGRNLYFADGSSAFFVLSRDQGSGTLDLLQELGGEVGPDFSPDRLFVSPDGRHVYAIDSFRGNATVWSRDLATGALSFLDSPRGRIDALLFRADGRRAYGSDTVWDRDPETGALALVEHFGAPGVLSPLKVPVLTEDGRNLYVISDSGLRGAAVLALRQVESPEIPDFRFEVSIERAGRHDLVGWGVEECPAGTVCIHGAVPGRTEMLLRVVGPKPNGRLWPTLVKFSTSPVDVTIEQISTGAVREYHLAGSSPASGVLPGLFDRDGFEPSSTDSDVRWREVRQEAVEPPTPPSDDFVTSRDFPDFRFQVRLTGGGGRELPVRREARCFPETLCLSGSLPGRAELFVRIVGPKPNGYLWPTIVRTTTSTAEVWVQQLSTGQTRYYRLEGARPGSTDLTGLFDREGFLPPAP